MTIAFTHKFVSAKADGADLTVIQPSNWNDTHNLTMAADFVIGRATAGTGVAEEIPCTSFGRALLAGGSAAAQRTSLGLVIGTNVQAWDADLDAIAAIAATTGLLKKTAANTWTLDTSAYITSVGIGTTVQAWDADLDAIAALAGTSGILKKTATNTWALDTSTYLTSSATVNLTVGYTFTANNIGTISSGTVTPNPALGNYQYMTNNGAHTIAVPASDCAVDILMTNGASAGAVTFSGYTVGSSTGTTYATTNGSRFILSIRRINGVSTYSWYGLQ